MLAKLVWGLCAIYLFLGQDPRPVKISEPYFNELDGRTEQVVLT